MVKWFLGVLAVIACSGSLHAQCGGAARATPVRSLIASRPILSTLQRIKTNSMARRMSACQGMTAPQSSCTQSVIPAATAPCPACVSATHVVSVAAVPLCENGRCDVVRNTTMRVNSGARFHSGMASAYEQALASAQYRAANGIRGHSYLDTHRTSGVGWSTSNPNPDTCLGVGGDYAVAQGSDGTFYATKFQ